MIVRLGGGDGGLKEYLEHGKKQGRELHRDQLDQRISLYGDLSAFELLTSNYSSDGRRYDHVTLSFTENHVTDEMLQVAVDEFREHALAAWDESDRCRIAFYAEAHRPRVLSYMNSETGSKVTRFTHIHIGIGKRDLLTGELVEPLGFLGATSGNLKYIDAFQESFNAKYGFSSPKDNPKITPENAIDILARYTGKKPDVLGKFNERKFELEVTVQKEILAKNITTWDDFNQLLEQYGEVSKMHKGQFNECYRVKLPDGKAVRLTGIFFQRQFIERSTEEKLSIISDKAKVAYLEKMQPRKELTYITETLNEWRELRSREIRYLHQSSPFYKNVYKPADTVTRRNLLYEIERKNNALTRVVPNHGNKEITTARNRVPGLPERNLDGIQKRSEMLLFGDNGVDVRDESGREEDCVGLRQAGEGGRGGSADTRHSIKEPNPHAGKRTRSQDADNIVTQPSSVIERFAAELRERYEQAADKDRYAEIRQNLDCIQLLNSLSHTHGINPDLYQINIAKDGSPRIQCGSHARTPNDFLTKELGLPWKDAAPILRHIYEHQINSRVIKPRASQFVSVLWKEFKAERDGRKPDVAQQLHIFDISAKSRRVNLANVLKTEQKIALAGLSGPARKAAQSLEKLRAAVAKSELNSAIKEERQILRESILPSQSNAWRIFLKIRAQAGDEFALSTLRKLDDSARANKLTVSAITGTLILDDERKRQRNHVAAAKAIKAMVHFVESNGDVTYRYNGLAVLRDEGRHLAVLDEHSEAAIAAGLLVAREKFGSNLTLTGSPAFKQRVVQVAVDQGIAVKFVDPGLEAMRQQFLKQKHQAEQRPVLKPALCAQDVEQPGMSTESHETTQMPISAPQEVQAQLAPEEWAGLQEVDSKQVVAGVVQEVVGDKARYHLGRGVYVIGPAPEQQQKDGAVSSVER